MKNKKTKLLNGGEWTLNNTGYMVGNLDPYSLEFVEFSSKTSGKVLDVGACYGIATLAALKKGAKHIIAVDNDHRHLKILHSRVAIKDRAKIHYAVGALPNSLNFDKNSIAAILCSRVLHLLHKKEIDIALDLMYKWLEPNGRIYLINDTPYTKYSNKFLKEFSLIHKERKQAGDKWPGYVENIKHYLHPKFHSGSPDFVTTMDIDTITTACKKHGFSIVKASFISRPDYPPALQNDGRENVGVIASKI